MSVYVLSSECSCILVDFPCLRLECGTVRGALDHSAHQIFGLLDLLRLVCIVFQGRDCYLLELSGVLSCISHDLHPELDVLVGVLDAGLGLDIGHELFNIFSLGWQAQGLKLLEGHLVESVVTEVLGTLLLGKREPVLEEADFGWEELRGSGVTLVQADQRLKGKGKFV